MNSLSKTPSPLKDRIHGSKVNRKGSASSEKSATSIKFNSKTVASLMTKLKEFKETHDTNKVSLSDLKAVYRRGLGAYSSSHRPTISGGVPNSRNAWAMARVNAFLRKAGGGEHKEAYVQDDDLLKYADGGEINVKGTKYILQFKIEDSKVYAIAKNDKIKVLIGSLIFSKRFATTSFYFQEKIIDYGFEEYILIDTASIKDEFQRKGVYEKMLFFLLNKFKIPIVSSPNRTEDANNFWIKMKLKSKNLFQEGNYFVLLPYNVDTKYAEGGKVGQDIKCRRCGWEWNTKDSEEFDKYVCHNCGFDNRMYYDKNPIGMKEGGEVDDHAETYKKWRSLVNMSYGELKNFYETKEGKEAGLSKSEANKQGISNGRESARWVMKMKTTPKEKWTPTMWKWANKQISFISRMSGNEGGLYDEKGNKTRKHTSLLIWGHNPKKGSSMKYENGGEIIFFEDTKFPKKFNKGELVYYKHSPKTIGAEAMVLEKVGDKLKIEILQDYVPYKNARDNSIGSFGKKSIGYGITRGEFKKEVKRGTIKIVNPNTIENLKYQNKESLKARATSKEFKDMKYENGGEMDDAKETGLFKFRENAKWLKNHPEAVMSEGGGVKNTCEKFDSNGERKIDMESIDELTYCVNKLPQTKEFHFHDGQYDADRKRLHKEIIYKIKKNLVCVETDKPIAIMMGGSPASGKSTFLKKYRPYLLENEILKVDADEIRSQLPEYKGWNATQTHLETKDIVNLLLSDRNIGIPCKFDLIYDGTMNNTKSYLPLIALLKSLGYRIYVVYIDKVPKDVIVKRALERYKKSGRFVPLEVIDDFFTKGKSALEDIKKEVDGYMIVDGSDSNYHVIQKGGMQLPKNRRYSKIGEPIKITTEDVVREYKRGGELNPDDTKLKNEVVHKSGKVGGMLVGQRHSEGGIKAVNKSSGQPLEMEGGEVVITRNAVSDGQKRMFEGKMMTNREILSKINESGGGVSFAKGGSVKGKSDCGCGGYENGGNVKDIQSKYPQDFKKGVREETREHRNTFSDLKKNKISLKEAAEMVVAKHLSEKPDYYKNYKHGGYLTFGNKQIPSLEEFMKQGHMISSPFVGDSEMYHQHEDAESIEHKYGKVGDKKADKISNLLAYETYLYDKFGILFSQLPTQVQNAMTLGKQALIDNYINS